jgi:hypothetical protein
VMKCPRYLAVLPLALLLCGRASAQVAPTHPLITVDEFGNGIVQTDNGTGTLRSESMPIAFDEPDTVAPISPLTYTLPFNGSEGFVILLENEDNLPGPLFGPLANTDDEISIPSDLLYFDGKGKLEFFSDAGPFDPADSPADAGFFEALGSPERLGAIEEVVRLPEVGDEENNGAFYTPTEGQPGWDASLPSYHFISDGVAPEPSSMALLMTGLLSGTPLALRRRRRA